MPSTALSTEIDGVSMLSPKNKEPPISPAIGFFFRRKIEE